MARCVIRPAAAAVALVLAACALKTPPDAGAIKKEALPRVAPPAQWKGVAGTAAAVSGDWVNTFHDERLAAAVAEAIANNPDLQVGLARVEQAVLYAKLAGAKLYPSV